MPLSVALDLAEPGGIVMPFLLYPAPGLLERKARQPTDHASLLAEITARSPVPHRRRPPGRALLLEALRESELRVLRYLPTNLTTPEIAREL